MRIVTTNDQIKEACSAVSSDFSIQSLQTFLFDAEAEVLRIIGEKTLPEIITDDFANRILRSAVVNLALEAYSGTGSVQITDSGIHVMRSDKMAPASDKKLMIFRRDAKERGWRSVEGLLYYFEAHAAKFPIWHGSEERLSYLDTLFRSSSEMAEFAGITLTSHLFQIIRPQLRMVQSDTLEKNFGESIVSHLRSKQMSNSLSAPEKKLLRMFQRILAPLAIAEAIPYRAVQVTDTGIYQASVSTFGNNSDNVEGLSIVQQRILSSLMTKLISEGESQIIVASKYIEKHPTDFGQFDVNKPYSPEGLNDPESNTYFF